MLVTHLVMGKPVLCHLTFIVAMALLSIQVQYAASLDNVWATATQRAIQAGQCLADVLCAEGAGTRPSKQSHSLYLFILSPLILSLSINNTLCSWECGFPNVVSVCPFGRVLQSLSPFPF